MEIIKKILFLILISFYSVLNAQSNAVIEFSFNRTLYNKIANDSIRQIYTNQQKYLISNPNSVNRKTSITEIYKFEDLSFYAIPKFRLRKEASKEYQCKSSIENFIEFNERIKYLDIVILNNKRENICIVEVPNFYYEQSRINNPSLTYSFDKTDYHQKVLEQFLSFPDGYMNKEIWKNITERNNNFFFSIYGINSVLFEIEKSSGILYANWVGTGTIRKRMIANEYIGKYIGQKAIREFASGNYDSGNNYVPCKDNVSNRNVLLVCKEISY